MPAISGRPDGRLSKYIYADGFGGVCRDMRYSANGLTPTDFADADQKVKNGTYRGFEKVVFTKVTIPDTNSSNSEAYTYALKLDNQLGRTAVGGLLSIVNKTTGAFITKDNPILSATSTTITVRDKFVRADYSATCLDIVTYLTTSSIGGSFLQTDIIGSPSNILATPQLANGWQGSWIPVIPDGTAKDFAYTRKKVAEVVSKGYANWTTNNGSTWSTGVSTSSGSDVKNTFASVGFSATSIHLIPYQAFAKQTKPSVKAAVYGGKEGCGDVFVTNTNSSKWGCLFNESVAGVISTDIEEGDGRTFDTVLLTSYLLRHGGDGSFATGSYEPSHGVFNIRNTTAGRKAVKALNYNVASNQQGFINYAYTELKHNGTNWGDDGKVTIVDNQSTKTDLNGNTVLVGTAQTCESLGWIKNKL